MNKSKVLGLILLVNLFFSCVSTQKGETTIISTPDPSKIGAQIETINGQTIEMKGPLSISNNDEYSPGSIQVYSIDFTYIQELLRTSENIFSVKTADTMVDITIGINAELEGFVKSVKTKFPFSQIKHITLESTIEHGSPADIQGELRMVNGNQWEIHSVDIYGTDGGPFRDPFGNASTLQSLLTNSHEFWLSKNWLLQSGLRMEHGQMIAACSQTEVCPTGDPKDLYLVFGIGGLKLMVDFGQIQRFTPIDVDVAEEFGTPKWKITWTDWDEESYSAIALDIRYLEIEPAPAGYLWIQRGGGLRLSKTIPVNQPDGIKTEIEFDAIDRLEFPQVYDDARQATLFQKVGNSVNISISPNFTGEGFSYLDEGIFCVVNSGIKIFIPFKRVKTIEFTTP
jgi:hypothetical protein